MKGSVVDMITAMVILFAVGCGIILTYYINEQFAGVPELNQTYINQTRTSIEIFNYGFLPIAIVGLFLVSIVLASQINSNPVFLPFSIIFLAIAVMLGAILANVYTDLFSTAELVTSANQFPWITYIMQGLPNFLLVGGCLIIIALYSKTRTADYSA